MKIEALGYRSWSVVVAEFPSVVVLVLSVVDVGVVVVDREDVAVSVVVDSEDVA